MLGGEEPCPDAATELLPQDAAKYYLDTEVDWSLTRFIIFCHDVFGDSMFFASSFSSWWQRFRDEVKRPERRVDESAKGKVAALNAALRTCFGTTGKEAKAKYDELKDLWGDKGLAHSYMKTTMKRAFDDSEAKMTGVKRRMIPRPRQLRSPITPGHQAWGDVFSAGAAEEFPHHRLSLTAKYRTKIRSEITENSLRFVQQFIAKFESMRNVNMDLGDLMDYLEQNIRRYPLANRSRLTSDTLHVMSLGRPLRNSPVHVRMGGDETVPWDNDFVIISRVSVHAILLPALFLLHDSWTLAEQEMVKLAQDRFKSVLCLAAITAERRTAEFPDIDDLRSKVERTNKGFLGGLRWATVAVFIEELEDLATLELKDVLRYEIRVCASGRLEDLLSRVTQLPARAVSPHVRLYGGMNFSVLRRQVSFVLAECRLHAGSDICPAEWCLYALSTFLELLVTIRTRTTRLRKHFRLFQSLVIVFTDAQYLNEVEQARLNEDEEWEQSWKSAASDEEFESKVLPDPFVSPAIRPFADDVQFTSAVFDLMGSGNRGKLQKPGNEGDDVGDEEERALIRTLRALQRKKELREQITLLRAELGEDADSGQGAKGDARCHARS